MIISKKEGAATGECDKGTVPLSHCARLLVDDLGKPDVQRIDLGAAELCRTGLVARHGSAIAQDIDIGKAHMAGHGAHLAAVSVEVKNVARLVTMVAAARTQLVHAAHADTRTLATRRAERLVLARRPRCCSRRRYSWSITSRQASMGRPADLSSWSALRSISSATTRMASDVARCRLQPAITRPTSTAENVSPVPGK